MKALAEVIRASTLTESQRASVKELIDAGRKMPAIALIRQFLGVGFSEAKAISESIAPAKVTETKNNDSPSLSKGQLSSDEILELLPEEFRKELQTLVDSRNSLGAIKKLRNFCFDEFHHAITVAEANRVIEGHFKK